MIYFLNMWLQGDSHQNIPPLVLLTYSNVIHFKFGKNKLSKMCQVIKVVSKYVKEGETWQDYPTKWTGGSITILWFSN